jgi:tRNA dimethylallyltransferase
MKSPKVIIITGPTASGKTQLALDLAQGYNAHIMNFDSMLFYRELNIGTAKPTAIERAQIEHSMIDICSLTEPMNAAKYNDQATPLAEKILQNNKILFLVGGSGFYLRAFIKGMYESATPNPKTKKQVDNILKEVGPKGLFEKLKELDPKSANFFHPNDAYRVGRALMHFYETGTSLALEKERFIKMDPYDFSKNRFPSWNILHFHLDIPKPEHEKIIRSRTDNMLKNGLLDEVANILKLPGVVGDEKSLQSIGYKESISFLKGGIPDLKELSDKISISTRQLAKSQKTFFNKIVPKQVFHPIKNRTNIIENFKHFLA